jgi:hypothetical protein
MQVSATLTGLTPGLTYHYRIVATGIAGTSVGFDQLFIAGQAPVPPPPPTPPAVATGDVTDVTTVGAALWGTLNTNGQATNYTFEYGTTTSYGGATPLVTVGPGSLDQPVTGVLTGLTPETTYHVRLTATNVAGSTQGPDQVFTTLAKVPVRPPAPPPTTPGAPTPPKAPQTPPAGSGPSLPAGPGPAPPASAVVAAASTRPDAPRPVVSQLRVRPGSLLATPARRVACAPPRKGTCARAATTRVTFWLSLPGAVTVTLATARSKAPHCEAARSVQCGPPPAPAKILQRLVLTGYAGPNALTLRLRARTRPLPPGRYVVAAVAQSAGGRSRTAKALLRLEHG